ncbi:MAG: leucine dehydrogenase, partial [Bdellovibrionales bacterium]|nr:leucine dehydrogenase [Bdellovibrionales bacterium]
MVFQSVKNKGHHEQIIFCNDAKTGLRAIIAIHSTRLGPALGGCRMRPYQSEEEALVDALNLSRAMSYKAAGAD